MKQRSVRVFLCHYLHFNLELPLTDECRSALVETFEKLQSLDFLLEVQKAPVFFLRCPVTDTIRRVTGDNGHCKSLGLLTQKRVQKQDVDTGPQDKYFLKNGHLPDYQETIRPYNPYILNTLFHHIKHFSRALTHVCTIKTSKRFTSIQDIVSDERQKSRHLGRTLSFTWRQTPIPSVIPPYFI